MTATTGLVIGAGIGGLAAALAMARAGVDVTVLEKSPQLRELGAGIQLAPNGIRALISLGVWGRVARRAVRVQALRFYDGLTGSLVNALDLGTEYEDYFGSGYFVVHRGDLYGALLEACRSDARIGVVAGTEVTDVETKGDCVHVRARGGRTYRAQVCVAADGAASAVRGQLHGGARGEFDLRSSGITVFRSLVPMHKVPERLRTPVVAWWMGPGRHIVHYPVAGGEFLNLAPSRHDGCPAGRPGTPVAAEAIQTMFEEFAAPARELIDLGQDWHSWPLLDRGPLERWSQGASRCWVTRPIPCGTTRLKEPRKHWRTLWFWPNASTTTCQ